MEGIFLNPGYRADGVKEQMGGRHNHCYTSPVYRQKVWEIDKKLAEKFADHSGVIAWHISNEFGGTCWCEKCQKAFREFLKGKYGSLGEYRPWHTVRILFRIFSGARAAEEVRNSTVRYWTMIQPKIPGYSGM